MGQSNQVTQLPKVHAIAFDSNAPCTNLFLKQLQPLVAQSVGVLLVEVDQYVVLVQSICLQQAVKVAIFVRESLDFVVVEILKVDSEIRIIHWHEVDYHLVKLFARLRRIDEVNIAQVTENSHEALRGQKFNAHPCHCSITDA
jgi:hypothetical protein